MSDYGATLYMLLFVFGLVLLVCWIVLPFAVLGVKPLLRELIAEQAKTNRLLDELRRKS